MTDRECFTEPVAEDLEDDTREATYNAQLPCVTATMKKDRKSSRSSK